MVMPGGEREALASALARYTQLTLRETQEDGTAKAVRPSMRELERRTGIPHQRLSDFLRNPLSVSQALADRVRAAITNPGAAIVFRGKVTTYVDAPRFTKDVLANLAIPQGATSAKFIVKTAEIGYGGYRTTEWAGDIEDLAALGEFVPGGYDNIARIVFDMEDE